jgi:flagellar biosynthetic protein FliR
MTAALEELATTLGPLVFLVSVRVGLALAMMPAPFGGMSPTVVRAVLGVAIALAITLPHHGALPPPSLDIVALGVMALGEALVGFVIGLTVRVTLAASNVAGSLSGFSMGLGYAESIDPQLGETSLAVSQLFGMLAAAFFLFLGGHHVVLRTLSATVASLPPGRTFAILAEGDVVGIGSQLMAHGLRIAAPVVATLFIVQLGMGLVARSAPRVQIFALSFAVAATAGLTTLVIAAPSLAAAIAGQVGRLDEALAAALGVR